MKNSKMSLAKKMVIALILGIVVGIGAIFLRVNLTENGQEATWSAINNLLFADITAEGNEKAIGLFYIIVNCLLIQCKLSSFQWYSHLLLLQ